MIEGISQRKNKPVQAVTAEEINYDELVAAVERVTAEKSETDPVIRNATNSEPIVRSRIAVGASGTVLGSAWLIMSQTIGVPFSEWDWNVIGPAIVVVWGGTEALRGRLQKGLKPLFSRWID